MTVEREITYSDAGATAMDACDGDLSTAIVVGGDTVNRYVPSVYVITYNVSDAEGNMAAQATRSVTVEDTIAPYIVSLTRTDPSPTSADNVTYTIVFNEVVTGLDVSDLSVTVNGVVGANIGNFNGSGNTYSATVATGTGNGTLRLDILDDNTIIDAAGNSFDGVIS